MKISRDFLTKPTIEGTKVNIRPFEEKDIERILEILDEPNLKRLTGSVSCDAEVDKKSTSEIGRAHV